LNITFENGDEMEVLSDQTWTGREGSIVHDSIYRGEMYDSRRDRLNWTQVGFNDSLSAWIMPESLPSPVDPTQNGTLVLQDMPPIRAGSDALHFETTISAEQQEYLHREEIGEIRGASLANGGIIKPVRMWTANSGISVSLENILDIHFYNLLQMILHLIWARILPDGVAANSMVHVV
jgi:hypothetical protein